MGYGIDVQKKFTQKEKADVVEAIVGELVLRQKETIKEPFSIGLNLFTYLPEEQLDETAGKLIVTDGTTFDPNDTKEKTHGDLIHEYKQDKEREKDVLVFHDYLTKTTCRKVENEKMVATMSTTNCITVAMMQMDNNYILRTSSEAFQVFKIYGMAVLSERTSLSLARDLHAKGSSCSRWQTLQHVRLGWDSSTHGIAVCRRVQFPKVGGLDKYTDAGDARQLFQDAAARHLPVSRHHIVEQNTRDGNRITQLRLPLHYTWANIDARVTSEQHALA
ncbi:unnamed protein product [Peronospora destructor]|uniref:Uncharacterized protein n=1 Tax=Peronospora destructor TaxID=86335 RepID=A0AAV0V7T7_9STRA|nr:unnamed protein product [Peronospora destructor]